MAVSKKRVLIYSIAYYPHVGGAEIAVRKITDGLKEVEWTMITCDLQRNLPREEKIGNVLVQRIRCPKILFPFLAAWRGRRLYKKQPFDVVWSIMTYAGFAGLFLKLSFPRIKFLLTLQEGTPISQLKRKAFIVYPLFWLMFREADMIQAISHFLADFGRSMGYSKEVVVVPNGVDLKYFSTAPKQADVLNLENNLGKKEGDIYLITTSRLVKKNAVDDCIRALKYLPVHFSFLIIGTGHEEQNLRALAKALAVRERVKFLGFMPQQDIPLFLAVSSVFVRPSRSEGFGNSFIEAMAAGVPVVATPVGGIPDFIDDRETGVFCRPDNPKSVAEAVMEIIDNPYLKEKIIAQGKERAIVDYSWDVIVKAMREKVFDKLLSDYKL